MRLPAPSPSPSPSSSPSAAQLFFVQSAVGAQFGCCIVACFLWPAAHSSGHDFGFSAMCTDSPFALALFCIPCPTPHRQLTIALPRATSPDLGQVALEISKINSHHLNHRQARHELRRQSGRLRWGESAAGCRAWSQQKSCSPFATLSQQIDNESNSCRDFLSCWRWQRERLCKVYTWSIFADTIWSLE